MRHGLINTKNMTPQQIRLFHLQASRNYGPFTPAESAAINSMSPKKQRHATQPDFSAYVRWVPADANLNELRTIPMPEE